MSEKKIDPLWKEGVLTLLIILPFIMFLFGERIDNNDLFMVYGTDLFIYIMARIVVRQKTGSWKW